MAAGDFLRIGTLRRHFAGLDAKEAPILRPVIANLHTVLLAAIGHVDHIHPGHHLEQLA